MDPMFRNKSRFTGPLCILPGPKEQKNITPYVEGTLQSFKDFGPNGMC